MENNVTVQRIINKSSSQQEKAQKYYAIMSVINNISLTPTEIALLAFMAANGPITTEGKLEFCKQNDSSMFSVNNMVYKLRRKGILVKSENKDVTINPRIVIDCETSLVLNIMLTNG